MSSTNPTVLVTGASSGIGAAVAWEYARRGADVVLVARRLERLQSVADGIRQDNGIEPLVIPADLTRPSDVVDIMTRTRERYGGLDVLVLNAGVGHQTALVDLRPADVRRIVDLNLIAAVDCVREATPLLRARGGGKIVFVSSVAALRASPGTAVYSATKSALEGLSEALRVELSPHRIQVTVVYPPITRTEFFDHLIAGVPPRLASKRPKEPADVARRLVNAAEEGRRRSILSLKGWVVGSISQLAPRVVDRRQMRTWKRMAAHALDTPPDLDGKG